jgi:hypothetical protein
MGDEQTPKMAANPSAVARAGAQRRLMDYLGSWRLQKLISAEALENGLAYK